MQIIVSCADKLRLNRLRARAKRIGLRVSKSRKRLHMHSVGGLMVADVACNALIEGRDDDLSVQEAEALLDAEISRWR